MGAVGIASLGAVAAVLLAAVAMVVLLRRDARARAELDAALAASRDEAAELRRRLTELERTAQARGQTQEAPRGIAVPAEFLITDAGTTPAGKERGGAGVPDRVVLSATLGEPLVRTLALAHGVRRALSAESRNRIRFAMRQELRRTRRRRRREMRQAWRRMQLREHDIAAGRARDIAPRPARDIA